VRSAATDIAQVAADDNELVVLESIHHYVEILDSLFNNVCELDIIFNFTQAYLFVCAYVLRERADARARSCLDEIILGGDIQETSKREVLRVCAAQDEQVRIVHWARLRVAGVAD